MWKSILRSQARKRLGGTVGSRFTGLGTCLMYHRIAPRDYRPDAFSPNLPLFVSLADFDHQMRYISENFRCISVDEMIRRLRDGTLESGSVSVTFDDGHRDNLELALPVLRKYQVPAAIYVTTGLIDEAVTSLWWYEHEAALRRLDRVELPWRGKTIRLDAAGARDKSAAFLELNSLFKGATPEEQLEALRELRRQAGIGPRECSPEALSWQDVIDLDRDPLITIAAHSVSHAVLSQLDEDSLRRELSESRMALENRLGHRVAHFAYPFGGSEQAGKREFEAARECGYESAFTTRIGHIQGFHAGHLHSLPRIPVGFNDDPETFAWKLCGLEAMVKRPWSAFAPD